MVEQSRRKHLVNRDRRNSPRTTERGDYVSNENQQQALLLEDSAIDSFLCGEYAHPAEDAPAPHLGFSPAKVIDAALRTLHNLDEPNPSHGAAVFQRFLAPLSRSERWRGGTTADPWKETLRGSLTPTMLARRIRASPQFHDLLDWEGLDVTEGLSIPTTRADLGVSTTVAFVSAAMFFKDGEEPSIIQFILRKIGGVCSLTPLSSAKVSGSWTDAAKTRIRERWHRQERMIGCLSL